MGGGEREKKANRSRTFTTQTIHNTGPPIGCGKKVKFRRILRDKFAEKAADFAEILQKIRNKFRRKAIFKIKPILLESNWFCPISRMSLIKENGNFLFWGGGGGGE